MYVVPRFAAILEGSGHDLPALSRLLIAVGRALGAVPVAGWVALAALLAFGIWRVVAAAREGRLEALLSEWATHVPGIRELVVGGWTAHWRRPVPARRWPAPCTTTN